jgi:predicted Zn finger-like uncharacterized protein
MMQITCPSCGSKYNVDPAKLGPQGRTVRCTSCGHSWLQKADQGSADDAPRVEPAAAPPRAPEPQPVVEPRPAVAAPTIKPRTVAPLNPVLPPEPEPNRLLPWAVVVAVIAAILGGAWYFRNEAVGFYPPLEKAYRALGIPIERSSSGLVIREVASYETRFQGERTLVVEGVVANTTREPRLLPPVKATILGPQGALQEWPVQMGASRMRGGETMPFRSELREPLPGGERVTLSFAP